MKAKSKDEAKQLKNMRWSLLRKGSRVHGNARKKLNELIASKLDTAKAWELKEASLQLLEVHVGQLDTCCDRALRSRLEPMQKVARMLQNHGRLLMNRFRAKGGSFKRRRRGSQPLPGPSRTATKIACLCVSGSPTWLSRGQPKP
jgi:hypothetical protein